MNLVRSPLDHTLTYSSINRTYRYGATNLRQAWKLQFAHANHSRYFGSCKVDFWLAANHDFPRRDVHQWSGFDWVQTRGILPWTKCSAHLDTLPEQNWHFHVDMARFVENLLSWVRLETLSPSTRSFKIISNNTKNWFPQAQMSSFSSGERSRSSTHSLKSSSCQFISQVMKK